MKEHKEQAAALMAAGSRDALALQPLNQTGRAPHESIGFHAQQACERSTVTQFSSAMKAVQLNLCRLQIAKSLPCTCQHG